jgi:putative peptidoglycan lipid II flippase
MSLNIIFSLLFSDWFRRMGLMPHGGLALANSLATALEMIALLVLMARRLGGLQGSSILKAAAAAVTASVVMGAAVWLWLWLNPALSSALLAAGGIVLGGLAYAGLLVALRISEVRQVWGLVAARLRG